MAEIITVTLQTITDVRHCVKVKETARVEDLVTELYKSSGIRSKVKLLLNKEELDEKKQLIEYQIADGKVIQMLVVPPVDIKLTVHVFKKGKVTLKVANNKTPNDVRNLLLDKKYNLGVSPKVYDIYYNSIKLEYNKPLHQQGIANDSHIYMKCVDATFKVTLVDAFTYTVKQLLEVRGTDKVGDVKARVIEAINGSSGKGRKASHDSVVLFHQQLEGVDYTELDSGQLEKYEVKPYDYLFCVWYRLFADTDCPDVNHQGQLKRIYGVSPQETVISLQLKIQDQLGIPVNAQKLRVPGLIDPRADDIVGTLENLRVWNSYDT